MRGQSHRLVNRSSADTACTAGGRFENYLIHLKDLRFSAESEKKLLGRNTDAARCPYFRHGLCISDHV